MEQVVWTTKDRYVKKDELNIHLHVSHGGQRVLVKQEWIRAHLPSFWTLLTLLKRQQVVSDTFKNHPGYV